jgi:anti-sigma regulatory factor (Ser/Thr protein kinase)
MDPRYEGTIDNGSSAASSVADARSVSGGLGGSRVPTDTCSSQRSVIRTVSRQLPPTARSASVSRRFLADHLMIWGVAAERRDEALLLLDELVANAVRHAEGPVGVTATLVGDLLRVSVGDDSHRDPVLQRPGAESTSGRGLMLVDLLADRWGVSPAADDLGKSVWFEIRLAAEPL